MNIVEMRCLRQLIILGILAQIRVPAAGVEQLISRADAVVTGSVSLRTETATEVAFALQVDRVLAGVLPGGNINVVHTNWATVARGPFPQTMTDQLYGVWFLVKSARGRWDVLSARPSASRTIHNFYLPIPPQFAFGGGSTLSDQLVAAVASAVIDAKADPEVLLGAMESSDSVAIREALKRLSDSGNVDAQAIGVAGRLERQVASSLQDLERLSSVLSTSQHKDYVTSALKTWWRNADSDAIRALAALAERASDRDIRFAALWALAAMHTKETLPALARLLESEAASEQTQALYGLSAFANGCPVKTVKNAVSMAYLQCDGVAPYTTDRTKEMFVFSEGAPAQREVAAKYWKAWWNEHSELH